jgi:hypothetical protein
MGETRLRPEKVSDHGELILKNFTLVAFLLVLFAILVYLIGSSLGILIINGVYPGAIHIH